MSRSARPRLGGGLYLVVDPAPGADTVLPKVEAAIRGGVTVLQVWNHWDEAQDAEAFVRGTLELARPKAIPVLVHERPDLLQFTEADGIHYDDPVLTPRQVRASAGRNVLYGVTCGNDLKRLRWAMREEADYISFCALFPSASAGECELVSLETVARGRALGDLPIFASGGITPENAHAAIGAGANGLAVISGVLQADDPENAARDYAKALRAGLTKES